ncbi:hypothetical protein SH668x_001249 [Planctomicrobium sp. SH668]|uniref:hypothetical protein n=1 Tax=Planctomicrobium sp. SH668 TaxID=3448126 RepID=UPI003F5B37D8
MLLSKQMIAWFLVGSLLALCLIGGCGTVAAVGITIYRQQSLGGTKVLPSPAVSGEERYWSALADFIEGHPERFADTDRVYKIGQEMKTIGVVHNVDRLDRFKSKMELITDANRAAVIEAIRRK